MLDKLAFGAVVAVCGLCAGAASALNVTAVNPTYAVTAIDGSVTTTGTKEEVRGDLDHLFDGSAGNFYSLGQGGKLTLDYTPDTLLPPASVVEVTFGTNGGLDPSSSMVETADLYFGDSLGNIIFAATLSNTPSGFVVGSGFTGSAVAGATTTTFTIGFTQTNFTQIQLWDTSATEDGFDVGEINVNVVPLPAAGWMLLGAAGLVGVMKRRQNRVA
jgi:hypothetical protein